MNKYTLGAIVHLSVGAIFLIITTIFIQLSSPLSSVEKQFFSLILVPIFITLSLGLYCAFMIPTKANKIGVTKNGL